MREYHRKWYHENKGKRLEQRRAYLDRSGKTGAEYKETNFEYALYVASKARAKRAGIEFSIELGDVSIPERCPYLDEQITRLKSKGRHWYNASLDRIDNTKGYVKGNVQVLSVLANTMKSCASLQQLETFASNILKVHASDH